MLKEPKLPLASCNYRKVVSIGKHLLKSKSLVISKQTNRGACKSLAKLLFLANFVKKSANKVSSFDFVRSQLSY